MTRLLSVRDRGADTNGNGPIRHRGEELQMQFMYRTAYLTMGALAGLMSVVAAPRKW